MGGKGGPIVSTTGVLSRELYELREDLGFAPGCDFMCVGSMGHAGAIAYGIATASATATGTQTNSITPPPVTCIDGDGACLMHLGQLAINGTSSSQLQRPLVHILINNGLHESVGAQPTAGQKIDFVSISKACGYNWYKRVGGEAEIQNGILEIEKELKNVTNVTKKKTFFFRNFGETWRKTGFRAS